MKARTVLAAAVLSAMCIGAEGGCDDHPASSDAKQQEAQEKLLAEGNSQIGMPAIKNFRERKILKDIIELRDQEGLTTYTYLFAEQTGQLVFLGESIGYGIPVATQFTTPQKIASQGAYYGYAILDQADPNGLFSPSSAEGTWILLKGPDGKAVPLYVEPRIIVSPFKLTK